MRKIILSYIFISILGLFAIASLFHPGFPIVHDGDVHLLRLTNFYQSLQEGHLIPRWAANVNYGYGQPVFEFFYPLPYYIASLLHFIGISFADSLKIILAVSLIGSGCAMFLWLSKITSRNGAILGSLLYMFAPFRFVDVYVRGDIGESLAFVFVPLVFYFIFKISEKSTIRNTIYGGISLALLILCHNVISLMFLPFILWYACLLWWNKRDKSFFLSLIFLLILGFSLAAFFWIPGLFEGKFTLRNIVTAGEYQSRFISFSQLLYGPWSYGGSGVFTVQLGILHWTVFLLGLVTLPFFIFKRNKNAAFIASLLIFTCVGVFLMFPQSNFIWSKILLLQNFQFPWRFLAIPVFSLSVLASLLFSYIPKKFSLLVLGMICCVVLVINRGYWNVSKFVTRPDNYFAGIQNHPADTGESTPLWGVRFMEHNSKATLEVLTGKAQIKQLQRTSTDHSYIVDVSTKVRLLENTLYFPGWEVVVDKNPVPIEFQDQQYRGLMTFYIPEGKHTVEVIFKDTKLRKVSDVISLTTFVTIILVGLITILWKKK